MLMKKILIIAGITAIGVGAWYFSKKGEDILPDDGSTTDGEDLTDDPLEDSKADNDLIDNHYGGNLDDVPPGNNGHEDPWVDTDEHGDRDIWDDRTIY